MADEALSGAETMKKQDPTEKPADLSNLLQSWKALPSLPVGFHASVWRRIDGSRRAAPALPSGVVADWLHQMLSRPAFVASYLSLLLLAGIMAGYRKGQDLKLKQNLEA